MKYWINNKMKSIHLIWCTKSYYVCDPLQVTTDLRQRCTDGHTGTSVSAPIVSGIIALALEAKSVKCLELSQSLTVHQYICLGLLPTSNLRVLWQDNLYL